MDKADKEAELSDVLGGTLDIFGLKIDLGGLLGSSEKLTERLEDLREKLKAAGGREALSDEEWGKGETTISGHFRTSGILGEREYHVGTAGPSRMHRGAERASAPPQPVEPPVDVFYEAEEVVVVAEVPGVGLPDFELKVENDILSLATKPTARRNYRKQIELGSPVDGDSLKANCRNGVLEVRLRKRVP